MSELSELLAEVNGLVNRELDRLIPESGPGPKSLRDAMRWSLFGAGKRFRPVLVFAAGRAFGSTDEMLVRTAAAIEMLHTYSLIHDDLPSMDDDDLRRGRETCHRKFGEATAILAGDALQALAFQTIAEDERLPAETRLELIEGLSQAAARMVVGQQSDLEAEGHSLSVEEIESIHKNKTGALIAFSAKAGAIISGAPEQRLAAISDYAEKLGLLFQITDDLLDVTQTTDQLGKTAGKDEAAKKATYPGAMGVENTQALARRVFDEAIAELNKTGTDCSLMADLASTMLHRQA